MNLNGVEYYYIRNAQGDIIGLFDKAGVQIASYTYDTWGKLIAIKDGSDNDITNNTSSVGYKNPYRYRGYRYDTETGLYYLQSRYYNPEWGRFINADNLGGKIGDLLSHNVFAYCKNNPVNMSDPTGHWYIWATIGVVAAVAAVIVVAVVAPEVIPAIAAAVSDAYYSAGAALTVYGGMATAAMSNIVRGAPASAAEAEGTIATGGQILSHPVLDNPRSDSALTNDIVKPIINGKNQIIKEIPSVAKAHGLPDVIDNFARFADKFKTHDGADLWQVLGNYNGVEGRFEWILDKGEITHRMFIEGGTLNGIPIMP